MNALGGAGLRRGDPDPGLRSVIKLACLAVGGQGGGVLTNWIVDLAERNGWAVQATSVAGVAQRTGATIYYVEMAEGTGRAPVFALAPAEGDVDILIAAEMMEAGRAILRGFVTPDRTTLIASSHRMLATMEKTVPGSGIAPPEEVIAAARKAAAELLVFDMEAMAQEAGSVISAALFGALAGSGRLPFPAESYRDTIRASGRGVEASLRAFELGRAAAEAGREETEPRPAPPPPAPRLRGPAPALAAWAALAARAEALPGEAPAMARAGLRKVVDYQDVTYGAEYLDRLEAIARRDAEAGGKAHGHAFTATAAKYLANAMCYDDILRVADLKTRATRFARVEAEVGADGDRLLRLTEYFHPGAAEVVSMLPAGLGARLQARPGAMRRIDRVVNRGRRLRSDRLGPFLLLYAVAGLRRWRRALLRHRVEAAHLEAWLATALGRLDADYAFAVETLKVRRLVKGYSDTHARGLAKFDRVMGGTRMLEGRDDAAAWTGRLIAAALQDAEGEALDGALRTVASFAEGKERAA
jgi:indolepyruvate ferredoxin oxidoreductase beta subunit